MFSGLRQGSLLYVLDKSNLTLRIGEVTNVSNPKNKLNQPMYPNVQPFAQQETTVDVQVKFGEEFHNFEQLPSSLSSTSKNNLVVSDNKEAMNMEVDAMMRTSRAVLDSVPYHEKALNTCEAMMRELNPQLAKEKEQEEKICVLEEKMGGIENTLNQMMGLLSDAIGQNRPKRNKED